MEPELLGLGDLGECGKIVDGADVHRPRGADHQEGRGSLGAIGGNRRREGADVDAVMVVGRDDPQGLDAQARKVHCLPDAAMSRGRCVGGEALGRSAHALAAHAGAERRRARDQHGDQVRHRGSRDEEPACRLGKAEKPAHPLDDLALDFDGRVVAAAEVRIEAGGQHLRQHGRGIAAAVHPAHEARVHVAGGIGQHVSHELAVDLSEVRRLARQLGAELLSHLVRNRLPDRPLPDAFDVIEDVVEHAVTLRAQASPVLGIEARARVRHRGFRHSGRLAPRG